jgi:tRNA 5-methylaminomethyl-2-thiouridine biosynthesis bifunctional protein
MPQDLAPPMLTIPVAGLGYALSLPDGALCFGASTDDGDMDPALRASDHAQNIDRARSLLPSAAIPDDMPLAGRVGWRSLAPDRLPIVGALPAATPELRAEQARFWPRQPGLMVVGGLASRGITWATLCAELVAAQLTGAPWPVETSLADALDPARFAARQRRVQE